MNNETLRILREFRSVKCHCGKPKQQLHSFCRDCYFSLPEAIRQALYRYFGQGYEAAYEDAIQVLEEKRQRDTPDSEEATQSAGKKPLWKKDDISW